MDIFKFLLPYIHKHRQSFVLGLVFVILSNLFSTYTPVFIRDLVNKISIQVSSPNIDISAMTSSILKFIGIYILFTLLSALFTFLMRQTIVVASRKIEFDLKNDIFNHYQMMDIIFFKNFKTGDLMSRLSEDIGKIRELIGPGYMYSIGFVSKILITIYLMSQVHIKLTIYSLIPLPFLSVFIYIINQKIYKANLNLQQRIASFTSMAQETYSGIRIVKSFLMEKFLSQSFSNLSIEYRHQALKIVKLESFFFPIVSFLMSLSTLLSLYFGGQLYIEGAINIGQLVEFIMYINMLTWPVMSIGWVANIIQKANASYTRYNEIMQKNEEDKQTNDSFDIDLNGPIEFKDVSFRYPETGILALDRVSFKINYGSRCIIVGKTGAGKSSIAELLLKFYSTDSGTITINGVNINQIPLKVLRKKFGYVSQDLFLFSDTIANNISFGNDNISRELIEKAAQRAQVSQDIELMAKQYETIVGEKGVMLSGGQKQRISIARAIVNPKEFYLFDDCLSAVDVNTENKLIETFKHLEPQPTMILITHRLYNHFSFDMALCLDSGKIVEKGTHEELIKNQGLYYELYQKQNIEKN